MKSLDELATEYGTDKGPDGHGHTKFYREIFESRRQQIKTVLEIGVYKGASLRMWNVYFPYANIYGIDNNAKVLKYTKHKIFIGDQEDVLFLQKVIDTVGKPFNLVIDDGGHTQEQHIVSFETLWPAVAPGGYYVIEDLHTLWSPNHRSKRGHDSLLYLHSMTERVMRKFQTETDVESMRIANKIVFIEKEKPCDQTSL